MDANKVMLPSKMTAEQLKIAHRLIKTGWAHEVVQAGRTGQIAVFRRTRSGHGGEGPHLDIFTMYLTPPRSASADFADPGRRTSE